MRGMERGDGGEGGGGEGGGRKQSVCDEESSELWSCRRESQKECIRDRTVVGETVLEVGGIALEEDRGEEEEDHGV